MMLTPRTHRVFLSYPLTSCLIIIIIIIIIIASKTQTEKKLHRINKVTKRKKKQIANLHTYMSILTNIKLDYSSAYFIYYCT